MRLLLWNLVLISLLSAAANASTRPEHLRAENRIDPLGIDVSAPHLSWTLNGGVLQRAYQVRAATSATFLNQEIADLWDSGTVESSRSTGVAYGGPTLHSRNPVVWQVRVWSDQSSANPSAWSEPAVWEMGLLDPSDWSAKWIAHPTWTYGQPLPIFAQQFTVSKQIRKARLYIAGLGVYVASLNGHAVTEDVLAPGNTNFARQVEYATHDVTGILNSGANTIAVQLGNGSYNAVATPGRYMKFVNAASTDLRLLAQLEIAYADGSTQTVASDRTWRTTLGPTTTATWYGGEDYDARRELLAWDQANADLSAWTVAALSAPPSESTRLTWRPGPPVRIFDRLTPIAITQPQPGVYVFDMGLNFAGWQQLRVRGPAGTTVTMRIGELCQADGTVSQAGTGSPIFDTYILSGRDVETWHPQFEYHGFRYVQVTGLPGSPDSETITGLVLRGANDPAGSFTSSNELLNDIHRIIDRAIQSNMLSIFTDCPDREKLGWLADMQLIFDSITRNYDVGAYMRTVVRNMAEAQTAEGLVPDFVPEYTVYEWGFRDDPNWGNAIILAPWDLYVIYGDSRTVETYYPNMQRYLAYLGRQAHNYLLDYGLGDWNTAAPGLPVGVTATYGYYRAADTMARVASLLGRAEDARTYSALAQDIAEAFNVRYFDATNHTYAGGQQAADALALDMGIVPDIQREAVLAHLIASIRAAGNHALVGIVALPALFRALSAAGRDDVIYDIATQTTNPSYGYQISRGATSLAEDWRGPDTDASQNHMMLGAIDEWFTAGLAGIRQAPGTVAYDTLVIKPAILMHLTHVSGSYQTPNGEVVCEWTRQNRGVYLNVTIPDNTVATIYVPVFGIAGVTAAQDIRPLRLQDGNAIFRVGPGRYSFYTGLRR